MLRLMGSFRAAPLFQNSNVDVDSLGLNLHYRITASVLVICFMLVSTQQHFGSPIHCLTSSNGDYPTIPEQLLNSYCFMSTTYTVLDPPDNISVGDSAYPGVRSKANDDKIRHHTYYQWVPLLLLLQSMCFSIPKCLWAATEGGLVEKLVCNLDGEVEKRLAGKPKQQVVDDVARYVSYRIGQNQRLGFVWIAADVLGLLNVVLNFYLTDLLLGGLFRFYPFTGVNILNEPSSQASAMFPILTKCSMHTYGKTGTIQTHDTLCIMNLNIVNEKIFIILWAWFLLLFPMSLLAMLVKLGHIILLRYFGEYAWESTIGVPTKITGPLLPAVMRRFYFSDCVLFHLISRNMHPLTYRAFVKSLVSHLDR